MVSPLPYSSGERVLAKEIARSGKFLLYNQTFASKFLTEKCFQCYTTRESN
jgi:hypothetical protein